MSKFAAFLLACLFMVWTFGATAATLRVPQDHSTVQAALKAAMPGDTVLLSSGVFAESVSSVRSGSTGAPIILDGQGVGGIHRFSISHSNIHLVNTRVSGLTSAGAMAVYLNKGAHYCVISNNVIDANGYQVYGISWHLGSDKPFDDNAGSYNLIISNIVRGTRGTTMLNIGGTANVIRGNRVVDGVMVDFIRLWGRSNIIADNVFSNNAYAEGIGNHPDFIQTFGANGDGSLGHVIEGNVIQKIDAGQLGQLSNGLMSTIRDWTFRNNVFIDVGMQLSCTMPEVKFYNNVFYRCNNVNGGHVLSFGFRFIDADYYGNSGTQYAHGCMAINNVFLNCGDGTPSKGWYSFDRTLTNVVANYNFVAINDDQPVTPSVDGPVGDLDGYWNNFKWYEPNGINGGSPGFVNPTTFDFRLLGDSPLIGKGLPMNSLFTTDRAGRIRGGNWDIGAYEFAGLEQLPQPKPPVAPSGLRLVNQ